MPERVPGLVTVLLRLPLFYNPDAQGKREPVEDEKFVRTAEEVAEQFGGGTLRFPGGRAARVLVGSGHRRPRYAWVAGGGRPRHGGDERMVPRTKKSVATSREERLWHGKRSWNLR